MGESVFREIGFTIKYEEGNEKEAVGYSVGFERLLKLDLSAFSYEIELPEEKIIQNVRRKFNFHGEEKTHSSFMNRDKFIYNNKEYISYGEKGPNYSLYVEISEKEISITKTDNVTFLSFKVLFYMDSGGKFPPELKEHLIFYLTDLVSRSFFYELKTPSDSEGVYIFIPEGDLKKDFVKNTLGRFHDTSKKLNINLTFHRFQNPLRLYIDYFNFVAEKLFTLDESLGKGKEKKEGKGEKSGIEGKEKEEKFESKLNKKKKVQWKDTHDDFSVIRNFFIGE